MLQAAPFLLLKYSHLIYSHLATSTSSLWTKCQEVRSITSVLQQQNLAVAWAEHLCERQNQGWSLCSGNWTTSQEPIVGSTLCEESRNLVILITFPLASLHLFIKRWIFVKINFVSKTRYVFCGRGSLINSINIVCCWWWGYHFYRMNFLSPCILVEDSVLTAVVKTTDEWENPSSPVFSRKQCSSVCQVYWGATKELRVM